MTSLTAWALAAKPGDRQEYFRGYLPHWDDYRGGEARDLFNAGYILLAQQRVRAFEYVYLAIKKKDLNRPFDATARECFWDFGGKQRK